MKKMKPILVLASLLAVSASLHAASPYRTDVNPALLYWQLATAVPRLGAEEQKLIGDYLAAPLDGHYREVASGYDFKFQILRRAAQLKQPCDWGIDMADGPETLLPHLAFAKGIAKLAAFRARYFLGQGQEDEAIRDLASAFVLARRVGDNQTLIGALVQIAMESIIEKSVAENFHALSTEGLTRFMAEIDASPAGTSISKAIGNGERSFVTWYRRKIEEFRAAHAGDETKGLREIRELLARTMTDENNREKNYPKADRFMQAAGGTSAGMLALVTGLEPLYDELQEIAALPFEQFGPANKAFFDKIQNSNNPFARELFPALEKARGKEFRALIRLEMLRAAIQFRLKGEAGLNRVRDPFGPGPFACRRFVFQNVDRGFELKSSYLEEPAEVIIFVEKGGPPFTVTGPSAGKPLTND